jgi:ABC-type branched-subunit amino acid transport system substrate-binding protein
VKTVGFIGFNDPYGDNWYKVFSGLAEKEGIRVVASERYARTDQNVTGQTLKLMAAKPDAVLIAAVGGPAVLPQATLFDQGYKGRVYQTHAVATEDFIKLGKEKVEGTVLAAGPMLVIDEIPDSNPTKKVAQAYIAAYEKQFGNKPATFGANTYGGLPLVRAFRLRSGRRWAPRRSAALPTRSNRNATSSARRACSHVGDQPQRHGRTARVLVTVRTASSACCRNEKTFRARRDGRQGFAAVVR